MADHDAVSLDDGSGSGAQDEGPELGALIGPRSYRHVTKALLERPWAVQAQMLTFMVDLLRFRSTGGVLSGDEMAERLEAARAQNGDRAGNKPYDVAGSVAIIPMYGLISQRMSLMSDMSGGTSIDGLRMALRDALADPEVSAIVFDVDSPGGSVDGITEFAAELRAVRSGAKPIVFQGNTLIASAALWLAAQGNELVVTPSGEVGSVGVYAAHEDVSKAQEMVGVKTTLISAGAFKTEGNSFEPLTDEARSAIQDQVDEFYGMFVTDVAKGRGVTTSVVASDYGQGRTLLAKKALAVGLIDRIDTLEGTVRRLQPRGAQTRQPAVARAEPTSLPIAATAASTGRPDAAWNKRMKGKLR
jgi:signal peptide peptidase SppA